MNTLLLNSPRSNLLIILITILWVLPWKVYALWTAAKKGDKVWFVVIAIINTVGILEIIYVFAIAKKKWSDVKKSFLNLMSSKK